MNLNVTTHAELEGAGWMQYQQGRCASCDTFVSFWRGPNDELVMYAGSWDIAKGSQLWLHAGCKPRAKSNAAPITKSPDAHEKAPRKSRRSRRHENQLKLF